MLHRYRSLLIALVLTVSSPVHAGTNGPDCESLAARAGQTLGLPPGLLPAIARVESARGGRAWPWTLNQGGKGSYHPDKQSALDHLQGLLDAGVRNVDLGCMQLNWRWHGAGFPDAATMMDPVTNTRYAAMFLSELKAQLGTWEKAVAAYHSRDPERGAAYARKVAAVLAEIGPDQTLAAAGPVGPEMPEGPAPGARSGLLLVSQGGLLPGRAAGDLRQLRGASLLTRGP